MLTSLDITRILAESASPLIGATIAAIEFYRKERALQLYVKGEKRYCLTMSYHPRQSGFFILSAAKSRLDTREKPRPFARDQVGGTVESITQLPNDRLVEIKIKYGKRVAILVLEIIGPNGNIWLLDGNRHFMASLRDKKYTPGDSYQPPALPSKLDPADLKTTDLEELFKQHAGANPARLLEKNIYGFNYHLTRTLTGGRDDLSGDDIENLHKRLVRVLEAYNTAGSIYAYRIKGKLHFYPVKITDYEPLGKFRNLSEAQKQTLSDARESSELETRHEKTLKALDSRIKRTEKLIKKLEADIAEAADYDRYRQFADLLKINLRNLKRGLKSIAVDDLFDDGQEIEIPLDPKLDGRENIEQYARRYRKGKDGLALLTRRRENIGQELEAIKDARSLFDDDFERALNLYPEYLPQTTDGPSQEVISRPYKTYQTSTGLTVFVGKSGDNNDRTTFEYARPYELWFHASQCPGSHVVMKFPHKKFQPSKQEIEEVAACAAHFSKARGSAKVPVSYTFKKFVRKPRKAKAGLVTIERETTILVEPRELKKKES